MWDMAVITPIAFVVVGAGLALWSKAELDRLAAAAGGERETTDGCGQPCTGGCRAERALKEGRARRAQEPR